MSRNPDRKQCAYQSIARAMGTALKVGLLERLLHIHTKLTVSRSTTPRSSLGTYQKQESLPLPAEHNSEEAGKWVCGCSSPGMRLHIKVLRPSACPPTPRKLGLWDWQRYCWRHSYLLRVIVIY